MVEEYPKLANRSDHQRLDGFSIDSAELAALNVELSALYETSLVAGELADVHQLLDRFLEIVASLEPFRQMQRGGIFLVEQNELQLLATIGRHSPEFIEAHQGLQVGDCLCGLTAESGEAIITAANPGEHRHTITCPEMIPHGHVNLPLKARGQVVGVMYLHLPPGAQVEKRQLKLLTIIGSQVSLALQNLQLGRQKSLSRTKIQAYVERLAVLHDIGLSLNGESDPGKLLPLVLKSAAELTGSGVGLMVQMGEAGSRTVAAFNAKRCQPGFFLKEGAALIGQRQLERFSSGLQQNAFVVSDLSALGWEADAHLSPRTILVGLLCDEPGHIGGYFMLGHKEGEADFSAEDEELISLLAAQSSVALSSAKSFENERLVAETLQAALLPQVPRRADLEIGLVYRSADALGKIGGDYYDFIELEGGRLAVAIGDVCGKGLETAAYTAMIKYILRANLEEGKEPGECLTRLNRHVYKHISVEKFITMCLLILDINQQSALFASAGHLPPIVCREGCRAAPLPSRLEAPLGVLAGQSYSSWQSSLEDICAMVMYTDGLSEARNAAGALWGEQGLIEALLDSCPLPAQALAERLVELADDFGERRRHDDAALVVLKLNPPVS